MSDVSTLTERLLPIIAPGLIDLAVSKSVRLVEVNLVGAINTTLLGIKASASSWATAGPATDALLRDAKDEKHRAWFEHMMTIPSLTSRKMGDRSMLTTSPSSTYLTRNQFAVETINLAEMNISTGVDEVSLVVDAISLSHSQAVKFNPDLNLFAVDLNDEAAAALAPIAQAYGYELFKGAKFLYGDTGSVSDSLSFGVESSEKYLQTGIVPAYTDQYGGVSRLMPTMVKSCIPGMKYLIIAMLPDTLSSRALRAAMSGLTMNGSLKFLCAIPIADDGSDHAPVVFWKDDKIQVHFIQDSRYKASGNTRTLSSDKALLKTIYGDVTLMDNQGISIPIDDLTTTNYGSKESDIDQMLMYLGLPLSNQHFEVLNTEKRTLEWNHEKGLIEIEIVDARVATFCTKIDKGWYATYQNSGFGLFAPRAKEVRESNIQAFDKLELDTLGICMDNSFSSIDPNIVMQTDLAVEYAKARKKACKDNDWLQQEFMKGVTYGNIRSRISTEPRVKAFFSVEKADDDVVFEPPSITTGITWTRKVASDGTISYLRAEGDNTEIFGVNETTADIMLVEYSQGAIAPLEHLAELGVTEDEIVEVHKLSDDRNSKFNYLQRQKAADRYLLATQYYSPGSTLHRSGYPVYRMMPTTHRNVMVMRMYADFKKIGDGIVRCIESFVSDVTISHLLASDK